MRVPSILKRYNLASAAWDAVCQSQIVVQFSTNRRIMWCNPCFLETTGYSEAEAIGMQHSSLMRPEEVASGAYNAFWEKLVSGQFDSGEYRRVAKDRREIWLQATYNPVLNKLGGIHSILKIAFDVTRTTNERAEAGGKVAAIERSHLVLEIDPSGPITFANEKFLTAVGRLRESVLGVKLGELAELQFAQKFTHDEFMARLDAGERIEGIQKVHRPDGKDVLLEASFSAIFDPTGKCAKILYIGSDVTDKSQLRSALDRAEVAVRAKASFLAHMSHEVRTPMSGVMGFAEILMSSDLSPEQRQHAQLIHESGTKMMHLLNDILDVSKIEAGEMEVVSERVDIRHALSSCIKLMQHMAEQKGLDLELEYNDNVARFVMTDPLRLRQIVLNLVGNAIKFTSRGQVIVRASRIDGGDEDELRIDVIDSGIGIEPELIDTVLSKFGQADHDIVRKYGGTGLGLTISNELAELLGGDLSISSVPNIGTTITLSLPLIECNEPETMSEESSLRALTPPRPRAVAPRILVAEDYDINQALIEQQLARLGVRADIVSNGRAAVAMVQRECAGSDPYRMVLMDLQMPVLGGLDATRQIREAGFTAGALPIVALTANAYSDDVAACLEAGMQAHISKPTAIQTLADAIEKWVPRGEDELAKTSAIAPPQGPSVEDRYRERRHNTLARLAALVRRGACDKVSVDEMANLLHKLAGTAAMFGEENLGEQARHYEHALRTSQENDYGAVLQEAAEVLRKAA